MLKGLLIKLVDNGDDLDQMVLSVDNQCYYSMKRQSPQYIVRNDCEVLQCISLSLDEAILCSNGIPAYAETLTE